MWDQLKDPGAHSPISPEAFATELEGEGEADSEERPGEHIGRPVDAEVDSADADEDRERIRGAPRPPPESQADECREREGTRGMAAGEGGVELRVAAISDEGPHVGQDARARTGPPYEELDSFC